MTRTFEQRYVAFVDILGFRDIVKRMNAEPQLFATVRDALKTINAQAEEFRRYRATIGAARKEVLRGGSAPLAPPTHLEMTAFSDCYVVSEKTPHWHVLAAAQTLGSTLLARGILSRGAIVHGLAYHRGNVVFGPAVIDAYELESQVAKYPRILVTESVRKTGWGYHLGIYQSQLFLRDADGCWFLNVLAPPLSKWKALSNATVNTNSKDFLTSVRLWLQPEIKRAGGDLRKSSKLYWLAHHFNCAAKKNDVEPLVFTEQ